jgi:hypothetical protein
MSDSAIPPDRSVTAQHLADREPCWLGDEPAETRRPAP